MADLELRLRSLLEQGRKIDAIKAYREATDAGLAEAKYAVEAFEAARQTPSEATPAFERELLALLEQGQKIAAIKRYRAKTGTGLKEAKDAIEALASKHGISVKGAGCASMMAVILVACAVLVILSR